MAIEAVVFDIGNVLIGWHPQQFYDRVIGAERRWALFAEVDLAGMNQRIDLGAPFRATVYAMAERHPGWRDEIRLWHDRWIEMATPAIPRSVALLRALRAGGVSVFALTNFGIGSFALAEARYDFLGEFDRRYISGHMGLIKPDPRIYAMLEERCGLSAHALLFTDDRAENVAAARARGWHAHRFAGPEGWARVLVEHRLLTPREAGL